MVNDKEDEIRRMGAVWQIKEHEVVFHKKLAEGGFGEVWLGEYAGHACAVKKMKMCMAGM